MMLLTITHVVACAIGLIVGCIVGMFIAGGLFMEGD